MKDDPEYEADFQRLSTGQGIGRHDPFRDLPEGFGFDEPPLYAHYGQLGFLDGLPVEEKNAILVRAAVRHLRTLIDRGHDLYCMVSVQGWDEWRDNGPLDPLLVRHVSDLSIRSCRIGRCGSLGCAERRRYAPSWRSGTGDRGPGVTPRPSPSTCGWAAAGF